MRRIHPLLIMLVACAPAACGDEDSVQILLFQASPDAIEAGQSTALVFVVQPSTAAIRTGSHLVQVQDVARLLPSANTSSVAISPADTAR